MKVDQNHSQFPMVPTFILFLLSVFIDFFGIRIFFFKRFYELLKIIMYKEDNSLFILICVYRICHVVIYYLLIHPYDILIYVSANYLFLLLCNRIVHMGR